MKAIFCAVVVASFYHGVNSVFWSRKPTSPCPGGDCRTDVVVQVFQNGDWSNGHSLTITKEECTGKQDIGTIVCEHMGSDPNCSLFSAWGTRVTSCADVKTDKNIFIVPPERLFMLPTHGVGSKTEIGHIGMPVGKPIVLETLSEYPRIFKVSNFFTEAEADQLIANALAIEDEAHRLKRSSTGINGYSVDPRRTSENAFDQKSDVAMAIKRRTFDLLGIFPYEESFADGIQVLRYNTTTGYATHMDWIEPKKGPNGEQEHDYDSAADGTNRFATILLYLSDAEEGGETVFPYLDPLSPKTNMCSPEYVTPEEGTKKSQHAMSKVGKSIVELNREINVHEVSEDTLVYLAEKNLTDVFPAGSWQRESVNMCRSRLAIKPKKAEAILFYSTFVDGRPDYMSTHGACPVIAGEKWAANLWVWNGPRSGYWNRNAETGQLEKPSTVTVSASFESDDVITAMLYWEDSIWEVLEPGRPIRVNTYGGHKWQVKMEDVVVAVWIIDPNKPNQRFVLSSRDLPVYRYNNM